MGNPPLRQGFLLFFYKKNCCSSSVGGWVRLAPNYTFKKLVEFFESEEQKVERLVISFVLHLYLPFALAWR